MMITRLATESPGASARVCHILNQFSLRQLRLTACAKRAAQANKERKGCVNGT